MDRLALREVHDVKAHMLAEADESVTLAAIDRVGEDPALTHVRDAFHDLLRLRVDDRERGHRAEVKPVAVQAHDAVVRARAHAQPPQFLSRRAIDYHEPAVVRPLPPARRREAL